MCGICGIINKNLTHPIDSTTLVGMTQALKHRGPDDIGIHREHGVGLGIQRLSIIDLKSGNQPIKNEDGRITVVCNGEIYNYKELRKTLISQGHHFSSESDVEVIPHLYEEYGVKCLEHLRGMFAIALWDSDRALLFIARDRMGIKPLYYTLSSQCFHFASEIKSILMDSKVERNVNLTSLTELFRFGFVRGPNTLFKGISSLAPGSYLIYNKGQLTVSPYWVPDLQDEQEVSHLSINETREEFLAQLKSSVHLHLRSDVEVGAWLSPGIDSSSIVALMREKLTVPIHIFSIGFEDTATDEIHQYPTLDQYDDSGLIIHRVMCNQKDFKLLPKAIWHCETPFLAGVSIPRMILSEATAERVKVVLTGEGADEVLAGYPWYRSNKFLKPFSVIPQAFRNKLAAFPPLQRKFPGAMQILKSPGSLGTHRFQSLVGPARALERGNSLFSFEVQKRLSENNGIEKDTSWFTSLGGKSNWTDFQKLQFMDMRTRLPQSIVHHLDRITMAHSLEARVPFLDHVFVEFCNSMPEQMKLSGFQEKAVLRRAMAQLLPKDITRRRKRSMTAPCDQWFRGPIPEYARDLLSEQTLKAKGYFNPTMVQQILDDHRTLNRNSGSTLMGILGMQLWDEIFLQKRTPN